ncbi:MAG: TrkA family potassium uptake protein [Theionarchaea archaeon]|nr:TrkA family potassium uptake protein [Theionarchaea archaeon]
MKQFVIIGLGSFGLNLAAILSQEGHEVLALDVDEKKIDTIKERVTLAVVADAADKNILTKFVSKEADAVIVGMDSMEASVLATLYLRDLGVKEIIVKAMSDDHAKVLKAVGATEIVYPEKDVAIRLADRLSTPNLIEHLPLTPEYSIVEITPPDTFLGKTLKELQLRKDFDIIVIAAKDVLSNRFQLIPDADFEVRPNSVLMVIGKKKDIDRLKVLVE